MYLPSSFMLTCRYMYVRAEMNVHAFMNKLDQKDLLISEKNCENLCTKSMESCPLVISHILADFQSREGDIHNFA